MDAGWVREGEEGVEAKQGRVQYLSSQLCVCLSLVVWTN